MFEFWIFFLNEFEDLVPHGAILIEHWQDKKSARNRARRMSIKYRAVVDIALAGDTPWNERYITTAHYDSDGHHFFERLN